MDSAVDFYKYHLKIKSEILILHNGGDIFYFVYVEYEVNAMSNLIHYLKFINFIIHYIIVQVLK